MKNDFHNALLSVGEVAVFAFSLLELLLTRILPLGAFLAGHLLLHFWRLLASIAAAAASGRRKPRSGGHSYLPAQEELRQQTFRVQHYDDCQGLEDYQVYEGTLNDHQLKYRIVSNDEADVLQGSMSATKVADVAAEIADHPHVADSVPSDAQIIVSLPSDLPAIGVEGATDVAEAAEELGDQLHVADLAPSDAKIIDVPASDLPAIHADVAVVGEDQAHVCKSGSSEGQSNTGMEEQEHVYKSGSSSEGQSNTGMEEQEHVYKSGSSEGQSNTRLGSSDGETSEEASPSTKAEMHRDARSSGRRRAAHMKVRVLPPSFSQLKRSLMQRSRRSSPAQSNSPKPIKKQSPRSRKLASSLRSSTSNANFMGKFRKHFMLDRAA